MGFLLVFGLFGHEVWLFAGLVLFFFFSLFGFFCLYFLPFFAIRQI